VIKVIWHFISELFEMRNTLMKLRPESVNAMVFVVNFIGRIRTMDSRYTIREMKLYNIHGEQTGSVFDVYTTELPMREIGRFETSADAEEFIRQLASKPTDAPSTTQ
jgi:hypothetical protein